MSRVSLIKDSIRELDSMKAELLKDLHKAQEQCLHCNVKEGLHREDGYVVPIYICVDCDFIWAV